MIWTKWKLPCEGGWIGVWNSRRALMCPQEIADGTADKTDACEQKVRTCFFADRGLGWSWWTSEGENALWHHCRLALRNSIGLKLKRSMFHPKTETVAPVSSCWPLKVRESWLISYFFSHPVSLWDSFTSPSLTPVPTPQSLFFPLFPFSPSSF